MLDFMRKRKQGRTIQVLFLVIILVFIFFGFGNPFSDDPVPNSIAVVEGESIALSDFQRTYESMKSSYREAYKERLTPEMLESFNLKQQTVDQLINATLVQREALRMGFTVGDDELRDSIRDISVFQEGGTFDQARYQRILTSARITTGEFEEGQRKDLLRKKIERFVSDAVTATTEEALELFRFNNEKLNLTFLKIPSADLLSTVTVAKEESEAYYKTHNESFRVPERIRFAYLAYPDGHFESNAQVLPADEETFYNDHKTDRFTTPAEVHARHILFSYPNNGTAEDKAKVRETATGVLTRARAGEDFATLATAHSQDTGTAPKGGDLGFFPRGLMVKPFEEAAFNLSAGAISDLVESQFGLHIIKAEEVHAERERPLDEVRAEIHQELIRERARDLAHDQATLDHGKIQAGAKLADVAQSAGLTVVDSPLVGREESLPDLGRQPELTNAAFGLAIDQVSDPVQAGEAWYLVSPRERVEAKIPDFTEVAGEVEKRIRAEKAEQLAKTKAEALLTQAKEKKDIVAVATAAKLEVEESGLFSRQGSYIPKIGNLPDLKKEAFRLTPESPLPSQAYLWSGSAFVVMLKEKIPAPTTEFEKQKEQMQKELQQRKQSAVLEDFLNTLKKQATITVNQEALLNAPS